MKTTPLHINISSHSHRASARTPQQRASRPASRSLCWGLLALALVAAPSLVQASDLVGVYAFVDKVVLEPDANHPERIQLWGGFALAEGSGERYAKPQRGYLYFRLNPGEKEVCLKEWKDLKAIAGTGEIVGFGMRYAPKPTVRKPETKPASPDVYATDIGLIKVSSSQRKSDYPPVVALRALQKGSASDAEKPGGKSAASAEARHAN